MSQRKRMMVMMPLAALRPGKLQEACMINLRRGASCRWVLGVEYDGRAYCGWQIQSRQPSVQAALEEALSRMAGQAVKVTTAGRTDTGVHATLQIVHFDTTASRPPEAWVRGVNSLLPPDIMVRWSLPVDGAFDARRSAHTRRYTYALLTQPTRPALLAGRVGWYHRELNVLAMQHAANYLLGEHNFTSFRAAECQAKTPFRIIHQIELEQKSNLVLIHFKANAFLQHMVRNIVGSLIFVGKGRQEPEWMKWLLDQCNREYAAPTFMSDGLYLTGVHYPERWSLPESNIPLVLL
jgi:tRNA pseudouridine38-40 synthase